MISTDILTTKMLTIGYRSWKDEDKMLGETLNLNINKAEFVCLLGPNGVGKSTLIRTLCGLHTALSGDIFFKGKNLTQMTSQERAGLIAIVLTERVDVGSFTVWDIISLGRYPYASRMGGLQEHDHHVIKQVIESVGVDHLQSRYFNELSDGERQKVMIARALAQEPELLILDEPTAFLDLQGRIEIVQLLKNLTRTTNTAILMSTHDLDLALQNADRLWLLGNKGLCETGAPEDLILNHAFEKIFQSKNAVFNPQRGNFTITPKIVGQIGFKGYDLIGHWTQHALEREGFQVISYNQKLPLNIEVDKNNNCWYSVQKNERLHHSSIFDLITWIRTIKARGI